MDYNIYIDCTHTYNSGLNTGIQRVVRNIATHIPSVSSELNIAIDCVILRDHQYYKFTTFPEINPKNNKIKNKLKSFYTTFRDLLPSSIAKYLYSPTFIGKLNKLIDRLLFYKAPKEQNPVIFNENDIILFIDTTWLNNDYKTLASLKSKKVKLITLIYDIIPITHSQFCTKDLTNILVDWYKNSTPYIDSYIAISNTVKEDLYDYIKTNHNQNINKDRFDYFYLGSDFNPKQKDISQNLKNIFESQNIYLTVSTIEPRKNHKYILDTFELLWSNNIDVKYVMIGRVGWNSDEFITKIKTHKEYNKRVFLLSDINDTELVYAYHHSKALIFASYIEGFGLPIIESLYNNLQVLCSDIKIHREIAKDFVTYFNLEDKKSLFNIIINDNFNKDIDNFNLYSWKDSAKDLITKVILQAKNIK